MTQIAVLYHSGYGHTQRVAQYVAEGAGADLIAIDADGHISDADWAALDAAFAANRDPLTGHPADATFQPLFQKILRSAPAPIGLG